MNQWELGIVPEREKAPESLDDLQGHFLELYGRRSEVWLPGRSPRISLLSIGLGDLQDSIRKEFGGIHQDVMFGRIVARIFGISQAVNNVSIANAMVEKYPLSGCSYCHSVPCQCAERRPDADLGWGRSDEQFRWGLREWQSHLDKLYGDANRKRGIENVMNRLFKEVAELLNIEHEVPKATQNGHMTLEKIEHEFALELSDCLAWVIAAANITGIDLEKATLERFWPTCWSCGRKPCTECVNFSFEPVREVILENRRSNG